MTDAPLTVIAITTAKPGKEAAVREGQAALVAEVLREEGCLGYALHRSLDDDAVTVFVETWASEALWRAHMQGPAMKRFQATDANEGIADFKLHKLEKVAG